jgi:excisionase family DNA binding protein
MAVARPSLAEPLLTVRETAKSLAISERQVHRLIKSGSLPASRLGRLIRININDIESLVGQNNISTLQQNREF